MLRYFVGFLITIGLIIILIIMIFGGGGSKSKVPTTTRTLNSYANTDAQAQLIIDGPINAAQNHIEVQITVGQDSTTFQQLQGYDGSVVRQQTFTNSQAGYAVFLHALTLAGFTKGNTAVSSDERGYCPLGDRYIFKFSQEDRTIERFWATSCGNPKTYLGNVSLTLSLFQAQVPGYIALTDGLQF